MEIIIGAGVSLLLQWVKQKFTSQGQTLGFLLLLCLAAAGIYTVLVEVGYWETVAHILILAGAFYTFIIQRFEGEKLPEDRTDELAI